MKPARPSGLQPAKGLDPRQLADAYPVAVKLDGHPDAGTLVLRLDGDPLPWNLADLATLADVFTRRLSVLILARDRDVAERVAASLRFLAMPAGRHS